MPALTLAPITSSSSVSDASSPELVVDDFGAVTSSDALLVRRTDVAIAWGVSGFEQVQFSSMGTLPLCVFA